MRLCKAAWIGLFATSLGCQSEETKLCHSRLESAQKVVDNTDSSNAQSVEQSLAAVQAAYDACEKAARHEEREQLLQARNQISAHLEYLKKKADQREERKLTAEELARLVKSGDPDCPRGQAYKHRQSGKEIRCTGSQPIDMGWTEAKEYLERRGYKVEVKESEATLNAEYGAELIVFGYAKPKDPSPPKCVTLYPPPSMSWQEAISRQTGARPHRLKKDGTIRAKRGELAVDVEEGESKLIVRIGDCPK